jgi:hypothetical protein
MAGRSLQDEWSGGCREPLFQARKILNAMGLNEPENLLGDSALGGYVRPSTINM